MERRSHHAQLPGWCVGLHLEHAGLLGGFVTGETDAAFGDRWKWSGRESNIYTELHYNRSRYLNGRTGLWLSEDPIRIVAGDYNINRYALNKTTMYLDPSGLDDKVLPVGEYLDVNISVLVPIAGPIGIGPTGGTMVDKVGNRYLYVGGAIGTAGPSGSVTVSPASTVTEGWNFGVTFSVFGMTVQFGSSFPDKAANDFGEMGGGTPGVSVSLFYVAKVANAGEPIVLCPNLERAGNRMLDRIVSGGKIAPSLERAGDRMLDGILSLFYK
ncbi:MAG: RHS repeat-associated core domain-containing protein [Gemmatales bacterium]